jgi:DNA-binding transcriptional LysR family regulator
MEHRQLLNFLSICEEKYFVRAAERRFITHQGLSRSIRELERELGVPLFERSRNGVKLTEYGRVLENAARALKNQHDYVIDTIAAMKTKSEFQLSIGMTADHPMRPQFLGSFISEHPDIAVSIKTLPINLCQKYVLEQNMQIGFSFLPIDLNLFDAVPLWKEKLYLVTGRDHPLAKRNSIKLRELQKENIISFSISMYPGPSLHELCRQNGLELDTVLDSFDLDMVTELCATGRYVSFWGRPVENLKDLSVIEIDDAKFEAEFYLIVNKRAFINHAAELFISYVKERYEEKQ